MAYISGTALELISTGLPGDSSMRAYLEIERVTVPGHSEIHQYSAEGEQGSSWGWHCLLPIADSDKPY